MLLVLVAICAVLGIIPAIIASGKGHSFFWWWLFGAALFIIVLPLSLLSKDMRHRCPDCAEPINALASKCPHCQSEIADRHVVPVLR